MAVKGRMAPTIVIGQSDFFPGAPTPDQEPEDQAASIEVPVRQDFRAFTG